MQRGSKHEWRNMRGRMGDSQRLLLRATNVRAERAGKTIQLFKPHLKSALPRVQCPQVPRSRQLTAGRVGSLRASKSLRMSRLSGGVAPVAAAWRLQVRFRHSPCLPEMFGQRAPHTEKRDSCLDCMYVRMYICMCVRVCICMCVILFVCLFVCTLCCACAVLHVFWLGWCVPCLCSGRLVTGDAYVPTGWRVLLLMVRVVGHGRHLYYAFANCFEKGSKTYWSTPQNAENRHLNTA